MQRNKLPLSSGLCNFHNLSMQCQEKDAIPLPVRENYYFLLKSIHLFHIHAFSLMLGTPDVQQQISPEFYLRSGIQTYF